MAHQTYKVTIENTVLTVYGIAFDGCHKIYLLMSEDDIKNAKKLDYKIYNPETLRDIWTDSCCLRFISRWDDLSNVIEQGWMPKDVYYNDMMTDDEFFEKFSDHAQFDKDANMFVPNIEVEKI